MIASTKSRSAVISSLLVLAAVVAACAESDPAGVSTISTEAFVSTYVDLRISALRTTNGEVRPEERDSILAVHSVTDADLFGFVDTHGRDPTFMQSVWDSVDAKLNRVRDSVNSAVMELPR